MSREENSNKDVWSLIAQLQQKRKNSDKTASDNGASQRSIRDSTDLSLSADKNETDKDATSGKSNIPAVSDKSSTDKFGTTAERSIKEVTGDKKVTGLESDNSSLPPTSAVVDKIPTFENTKTKLVPNIDNDTMSIVDKETTSDKVISDGNVGCASARGLSIDDKELKNSVSEKEISKLNIELTAPVMKHDLIMIDDVMRTRPVSNPVITLLLRQVDSSASQINGNRLVIRKAIAANADGENNADDDATALKLISSDDARDKPMRTDASVGKNYLTTAKARRPDSLTLSPVSPNDTDEDRTPRPLSGSFRNSDATPLSAFRFIELPLRFRQHTGDSTPVSVPETPYPDSAGTLKYHRELETESRDVSDDIIVALDWIQQELRQLKCTNRALVRDLLGIGASIHQLRGLTDCQSFNPDEQSTETGEERSPDWMVPVHPSASADLCILLDGHLTSPLTVKKKRRMRLEEGMTGRRSLDTVTTVSTRYADQNEFYV